MQEGRCFKGRKENTNTKHKKNKNNKHKQVIKENGMHKQNMFSQRPPQKSASCASEVGGDDEVKAVITRGECLDKHVGQSNFHVGHM